MQIEDFEELDFENRMKKKKNYKNREIVVEERNYLLARIDPFLNFEISTDDFSSVLNTFSVLSG